MSHTVSIAEILGLGDDVRTQDPAIHWKGDQAHIRPYVDKIIDGRVKRVQERIYLTATSKRDAIREKTRIMAIINQSKYVVQAQMNFGELLDYYLEQYVRRDDTLGAGTRAKYESHIKNHIRPAFGSLPLAHVTTKAIDAWMKDRADNGMAWSTRMDLRNRMSGIFEKARRWELWKEPNPAEGVTVGKQRAKRTPVKLTTKQTRDLLASLPADVRLVCEVALYCACRISEVLGLTWKHVDFKNGVLQIRQRWYRGDLDVVKSVKSRRDIPMGLLAKDLRALPGDHAPDDFVFGVQTHVGDWKTPGVCRDDRDINQHFLRPAAIKLGVYVQGFGFHAFRREAVTEHSANVGAGQAQRMAGHSKADMTQHYTLSDRKQQTRSVLTLQKKMGRTA